ncbi:hypothetical protein O5478_17295 [Escherichia coli]|nr:hypothetical protein [Escherichia coli]
MTYHDRHGKRINALQIRRIALTGRRIAALEHFPLDADDVERIDWCCCRYQ